MGIQKYALVEKGEIIKFRSTDEYDNILIPKLVAHNYLPVVETNQPEIDQLTQTLSDSYEVLKDRVEHKWTITEKSPEEIKTLKEEKIKQDTLAQIEQVWDDSDWEVKIIAAIEKKHTDENVLTSKEKQIC